MDLVEGHESGNIGKDPIDLIWVTLKQWRRMAKQWRGPSPTAHRGRNHAADVP